MEDQRCAACGAPAEDGVVVCRNCGEPFSANPDLGVWGLPRSEDEAPEVAPEDARDAAPRKGKTQQRVVAALILTALVGGILASLPRGQGEISGRVGAAGCGEVQAHPPDPETGQQHLAPPARAIYPHNPPSSGPHYGATPVGGAFSEERAPELWIHNLEHGHIVILYGPGLSTSVRRAIVAFARARRSLVVASPSSTISEPLVMVAWSRVLRCDAPADADEIVRAAELFFNAYVGRFSPEGTIPASSTNEV